MPEPLQRLRRGLLRNPGGDRVMAQVLAIVLTAGLDAVLVAVELALETGPPGKVSVEHVVNVLGRLNAVPAPPTAATSLQVARRRWPTRRATTACVRTTPPTKTPPTTPPRRPAMTQRDVTVELKALRLHGMAGAWADLVEQGGNAGIESSRWLIEHLLQAEGTDRAMRSVSHQMHAARFPVHRDLAGFDFEVSPVDRKLVSDAGHSGLHRRRAQRRAGGRAGHGQDAPGHGHRRVGHHPAWQAGALLLDGRSGQCAGAGEGAGQGRAHCVEPAAHGPGHPRRAGLPAVQPGRRGACCSTCSAACTSTPA